MIYCVTEYIFLLSEVCMDNFSFYSPTFFFFGKGTENQAGELVRKFGGNKVLLHYGGGSVIRSGLLDRVKQSLTNMNLPFAELGAKEEDIPKLVDVLCDGTGRGGSISGFVTLNKDDCTNIYKLML